jgi:hypothetical protein
MGAGGQGLQASTNLTQVSDWLTKIIVGVGLVEATTIYEKLSTLSLNLGGMLFDGMFGAPLVVPSLMISGAILGFLYAYLFTQLFLATLMAVSAQQVASPLAGLGQCDCHPLIVFGRRSDTGRRDRRRSRNRANPQAESAHRCTIRSGSKFAGSIP